ncbi:MAG: hypothetical protein KGI27_12505 [Thaumarchaeota archaeon]|nr:hypothetical protein [Nitrososphaerota archaeon]
MLEPDNLIRLNVMGWGNRGWVEIIETILEVCQNGALKTHVMYRCNLNSKQMVQYVGFLENHRLIKRVPNLSCPSRDLFMTTELGKRYMASYKELENIFSGT